MPVDKEGNRAAPRTLTNAAAYTEKYKPAGAEAKDQVRERKAEFEEVNAIVRRGGGWIVSVPGAREVRLEVLPGSPLPNALRARGYQVERDEPAHGERILPHSIVEWFVRGGDGTLELATAGSTKPIASRVTHAGITATECYWFNLI
jgi:hypothetical protein